MPIHRPISKKSNASLPLSLATAAAPAIAIIPKLAHTHYPYSLPVPPSSPTCKPSFLFDQISVLTSDFNLCNKIEIPNVWSFLISRFTLESLRPCLLDYLKFALHFSIFKISITLFGMWTQT